MKVACDILADVVDAYVVADSAYSSAALIAELEGRGCTVVIGNNPMHRHREIDTHLYRERFGRTARNGVMTRRIGIRSSVPGPVASTSPSPFTTTSTSTSTTACPPPPAPPRDR